MSQSDPLPLESEDLGGVTVVRIKTPMLRSDAVTDALFDHISAIIDGAAHNQLTLNFDGVEFFASAAIARLVQLLRQVKSAGGGLKVCKVSRSVESLLRMTHLADILPIYEDEQEAVRSFAKSMGLPAANTHPRPKDRNEG